MKDVRRVLEKSLIYHREKMNSYRRLNKDSKTKQNKIIKHMHKLHKTRDLAEELGYTVCVECGGLRKK